MTWWGEGSPPKVQVPYPKVLTLYHTSRLRTTWSKSIYDSKECCYPGTFEIEYGSKVLHTPEGRIVARYQGTKYRAY